MTIEKPVVAAVRYRSSWGAVRHWSMHLCIATAVIIGAAVSWSRDETWAPRPVLVATAVFFVLPWVFSLSRILIDGGLVPRVWVSQQGDYFRVWSAWSLLCRRVLAVTRQTPAALVIRRDSQGPLLGGSAGDWVVIGDGKREVTLTVYSKREPLVLERLVEKIEGTGLPCAPVTLETQ